MKSSAPFLIALATLLFSAQASAKALVSVSIQAEKEVTVNSVVKRVPAGTISPGDVIFYTLRYVNSGDEPATAAVLEDPIPKGTTYCINSAFGNEADITFSIDGGRTFKKPTLLTYDARTPEGKTEKRYLSPEKYTHIRWTVGVIPPGGSGRVGFHVRVK